MEEDARVVINLPVAVARELVDAGVAGWATEPDLRSGSEWVQPVLVIIGTAADTITLVAGPDQVRMIIQALKRWIRREPDERLPYVLEARGPGGSVRFELHNKPNTQELAEFLETCFHRPGSIEP